MSRDFRVISRGSWLLVELGLIAFSSTPLAEEAADYAYHFYAKSSGLPGPVSGLESLAQKGLHFLLFFALGMTLFYLISGCGWRKVLLVMVICFAVGLGAETIQSFFPTRTASIVDVVLNLNSGTLAALLLQRAYETPKRQFLVSGRRHYTK